MHKMPVENESSLHEQFSVREAEFKVSVPTNFGGHLSQVFKGLTGLLGLSALGSMAYWASSWFCGKDNSPKSADIQISEGLEAKGSLTTGSPQVFRGQIRSSSLISSPDQLFSMGTLDNNPSFESSREAAFSEFTNPLNLQLEYRESWEVSSDGGNYEYFSAKYAEEKHSGCDVSLTFGFVGSLLVGNPLPFGAASLLCVQGAYGQIVNGQIPDQLLNIGDPFDLKINITELFGEQVTDVIASLSDGSALPDWLAAGPMVVGSLTTDKAKGVAVSGSFAYMADDVSGLKIIDVSNPNQPILRGGITTNSAMGVALKGNLAYVADGSGGLKIIDVSNPNQPILRGGITTNSAMGVALNANLAYVADGSGGLKIVDVSDSSNPVLIGSLNTKKANGVAVNGSFAYVADDVGGLQIIDVSIATKPRIKGQCYTYVAKGVAISGNFAYVADDVSGLKIIDVSNPANPVLRSSITTTMAAGIVVESNFAYVADWNGGLKIIDISNAAQPVLRGSLTTTLANGVVVRGNFAYVADSKGLKIVDLISFWEISGIPVISKQKYSILISAKNSLLQTVKRVFGVSTDYFPRSINNIMVQSVMPGEGLNLNLDVDNLFHDNDINDTLSLEIKQKNSNNIDFLPAFMQLTAKPFVRGRYTEVYFTRKVAISGNLAFIADSQSGLKIIDVSDPTQPLLKGSLATSYAQGVAVSGNVSCVADAWGGLKIIDVSNVAHPILIGNFHTSGNGATAVVIKDNLAYVSANNGGLNIIDISNPSQPFLLGSLTTTDAQGVAISGNFAYLADYGGGLRIIDVSISTKPLLKGSFPTISARGITVIDNLAYVADEIGGLKIIDISNATQPILRGSFASNQAYEVAISGNFAYLADDWDGIKIIDISNTSNPAFIGKLATAAARGIVINGNQAYVADGNGGLKIVDLTNYQFNANPSHDAEGNYELVVIATDPTFATANISFMLRVEAVPKLMVSFQPQIALIGQPFSYFVSENTFWDPNNDVITYSSQSKPRFLSFNPSSATFWGIPSDLDKGSYNITIFATDRITTPTPANLNLLVHYAPTLNKPVGQQVADISESFVFTLDANTFADRDESFNLTYTAMQVNQYPLPDWLRFNNQTRIFYGIPQESDKGALTLEVVANDGLQGQVSATFDLVVEHFPRLTQNFSTVYAAIGHNFAFNAFNYFVDIDGNPLQFSAKSFGRGIPSGLTFDPMTCRLSGIPEALDCGSIPITLTASDSYGGSVQAQFNLTVDDFKKIVYITNPSGAMVDNRIPTLAGTLLQQSFTAGVRGEFSIRNAFQDLDGDPLIFNADFGGSDNWLMLDRNTGLFSGTPSSSDAATYATRRYTIGVTAMDPANRTAAGSFDILLLGPSLTEKTLNALFVASGIVVAMFGYYQKKYLLWNWCRKGEYKKPDVFIAEGDATGVIYRVNYPSNKIKSIIVTTIKDRKCLSRDSCCCKVLKNTDEYNLPVRISFHVFDWLLYDRTSNSFQVVGQGPDEEALNENIEIQIRGADNRIMEEFTIKVRNRNELQATGASLSDVPLTIPLEEKASLNMLSSFSTSASSAAAMQSIGLFSTNSSQEIKLSPSVKTSTLQTPLLNA